jgi:hypothetical protein
MPNFRTTTKNFVDLLKEIPKTAQKVKVMDQYGSEVWKKINSLVPSDTINIGGLVVYTEFDKDAEKLAPQNPQVKETESPATPPPTEVVQTVVAYNGTPSKTSKSKGLSPEDASEEARKIKEKIARKKEYIKADSIYQVIKKNPDSLETLQNIMLAFSEEQSAVDFERNYLEEMGIPATKLAMQRVRILQALGETWLNHKELLLQEKTGVIDLNSDSFGRLFKFIVETFSNIMLECGVDPQVIKMIIVKTAKQIDETWKAKALRKMMGETD